MKKYRSIWLFLIGVVCFSLFVCLSIESTEYAWEYNYNSNFLKNGYISIEYNDKNISAYLKYDKNLDKIKSFYKKIINSSIINYLEIIKQPLCYKGNYDLPIDFVIEKNKKNIEQIVDDKKYTMLNSLQIGRKSYYSNIIDGNMENGRKFSEKDFVYNNKKELSVILGNSYKKCYRTGDKFDVNYLNFGDFHVKVIGFLKKDSEISYKGTNINLNNYIIAPSLDYQKEFTTENQFLSWLYYVKTTCFVSTFNKQNYILQRSEVNKIISDYKINYTIEEELWNLKENIFINSRLEMIYLISSMIMGSCFASLYIFLKVQRRKDFYVKIYYNKLEKLEISFIIHTVLEIALCIIIADIILVTFFYTFNIEVYAGIINLFFSLYGISVFIILQFVSMLLKQKNVKKGEVEIE